jgi:mitochondrial FAD-linked sulfhydryl oxidase
MSKDPSSEAKASTTNAGSSTKLPPGMVIGPDGKPCKICTAFRNWQPRHANTIEGASKKNRGQADNFQSTSAVMAALAAGTGTAAASANKLARPDVPPPNCPPDVEQLGRATWTFLHTTAAYYPEKPTPTQRTNMLMLLRSLPILYPCTSCAGDFDEDMRRNPPDVSGRMGLSRWLCERHNEVNAKLGKEAFDCAKTDERWKDGPADGSCD